MPERLSRFIRELTHPRESEKNTILQIGSAVFANPEHPAHTEDRIVATISKDRESAMIAALDGVGSGGKDSELAADTVRHYLENCKLPPHRQYTLEELKISLGDIFLRAANRLRAQQHSKNNGLMDSTASVGVVFTPKNGNQKVLLTAHVGDSRLYKFSAQSKLLTQLTKDDTLVQALIDNKFLDSEKAFTDIRRNKILKAVSSLNDVKDITFTHHTLEINDVIMATTDGLTDNVPPNELPILFSTAMNLHTHGTTRHVDWNSTAHYLAKKAYQTQKEKKHSYAKPDDIGIALLQFSQVHSKK